MSVNAERGPVAGAPFENTQAGGRAAAADVVTRSLPVANATRHRRSRRTLCDRGLVRCPLCSFSHWHVAFEGATSHERSPACRPSATYTVQVVRVVPATVLPAPAGASARRQRGVT
jgi:hypothetical protein